MGVKLLERHAIWLEGGDYIGNALVNFHQAIGERLLRLAADDAGFDDARLFWIFGDRRSSTP